MRNNNAEIKCRCNQLDQVRQILLANKAHYHGTDHQVDTYFRVPDGRLKLREGNIENSLIYYSRPNTTDTKISEVQMYHTTPPSNDLKTTLSAALGVLAVVDKQREIYFIEHTKFHLDTVANLGTFVEIEVIDKGAKQAIETLVQQCNDYVQLLGLLADDMIAVSYSDLILNNLIKI